MTHYYEYLTIFFRSKAYHTSVWKKLFFILIEDFSTMSQSTQYTMKQIQCVILQSNCNQCWQFFLKFYVLFHNFFYHTPQAIIRGLYSIELLIKQLFFRLSMKKNPGINFKNSAFTELWIIIIIVPSIKVYNKLTFFIRNFTEYTSCSFTRQIQKRMGTTFQ